LQSPESVRFVAASLLGAVAADVTAAELGGFGFTAMNETRPPQPLPEPTAL